ncbi:hypothetical protein OG897_33115 [Streptomyces sp. NBC_00237]|uniref:hypothetical protein n=1 Tax=Streptomyces sp. NBC_00237 TaxID=2975687 RepID=UPI0022524F3B|nr:hypothetical protein [Streptomyces sp. NBC_00237]MCX5206233.1 hypothetical protein [Streptomyces sp. NBC_00237]
MHRPGSWLRRTRGGLACASACLLLGALSHVAAGGILPGPGPLGVLFVALALLGSALFGERRYRFDIVTLTLGGTQFVLHLAFHRLTMPDPDRRAPHMADGGGPAHHAMGGHHAGAMSAEAASHSAGHSMGVAMTAAHALATLGTALCVIHGERVLRRLATLVLPRCLLAVFPVARPVPPEISPTPPPAAVRVRFGVLLASSCLRRGPPRVMHG